MAGHLCPWWFSYAFDNPFRRLIHPPEAMLDPYANPGMKCLDLGCGRGYFSLGLARLVKPGGKVFALDQQKKMLSLLQKRAARAGLDKWIDTRQTSAAGLGLEDLSGQADFALCFWMLHEVKGKADFLAQAAASLKPGGLMVIAEPKGHVSLVDFEQCLAMAARVGLEVKARPAVALSRAALLKKV